MMYIVYEDGKQITWRVGHEHFHVRDISKVSFIQVDGDELHEVLDQISGIPGCGQNVVTWFGDHAKFIVENLR